MKETGKKHGTKSNKSKETTKSLQLKKAKVKTIHCDLPEIPLHRFCLFVCFKNNRKSSWGMVYSTIRDELHIKEELSHPDLTSLIPQVLPGGKAVQRSKGKNITEVAFCLQMPSFYKIPYHSDSSGL